MSELKKMLEHAERMLKQSINREFWEGRVLELKKAIEEENIVVSKVEKFWEEKS